MRRPYIGLKPARLLRCARNDRTPPTLTLSRKGGGINSGSGLRRGQARLGRRASPPPLDESPAASVKDGVKQSDKPVRLSGHAQQQLRSRGTTEPEVIEAIRTEPWQPAELGKLECRKDFVYNAMWNQRHYETKQVRPVFVEEPGEIVVVTVYVYYF